MTIRILETLVDASGVAPSALSPAGDALPPAAPLRLTLFHGLRPPPISVSAYVERIAKYSKCSPVCFVLALMYLQRAARADVAYLPTPLNVHRSAAAIIRAVGNELLITERYDLAWLH